jgi:intein-encoded DNA endonuclease-like protein
MPARNFTDTEEAEIAKIYLSGKSTRDIAKAYGLNHHISICSALERQGITQRAAPERNRLYKFNINAFDKIDNEQSAYWWGFIYADGNISRRSLTVGLKSTDASQLVALSSFLQSESPIKFRDNYIKEQVYYRVQLLVTDRYFSDRLRQLGIIPHRPIFKDVLLQLPEYLISHWIRGYFDGDGSARTDMAISIVGQQRMLIWMREVFANGAGTNPNLRLQKHTKSDIYYLNISGRIQALKIADYLYKDATVWLDRKKIIVDSWRNVKGRSQ